MDTVTADSTSIAEAVADAANEIAATNFEIAKAVATPPAPGTRLTPEASTALQAQAEVAAAVSNEPMLPKPTLKTDAVEHGAATTIAATLGKVDHKLADAPPSPPPQPNPNPNASAADAQTAPANLPADGDKAAKPHLADGAPLPPAAAKDTPPDHRSASAGSSPQGRPSSDALLQATTTVQPQSAAPTTITAVPAAQLGAAAATGIAVPLNGLAIQIMANARNGRSRFEIRLDPAELGRIDVRLDVDRHGHVTSHLTVERPETLAMLRQDAPQLQRALEDAGLKTGNNGLQFSLRDQSSSGNQGGDGQSGRNAHRLIVADADSLSPVAAGRSYGFATGSMRGLDIRV